MLRTRIAEAQGRPADGLEDLKNIPDSDPISPQAWLKAGQLELARHHARAAETAFRRSLALDPDQVRVHRELGYLYALHRRKADFDAQFHALAQLIPLDYVLVFAWCQNYCRLWDPDKSRKILRRFVAEDPDDRDSRLALAICYKMTAREVEAEAELSELPDSDPDARAIRIQLAMDKGDMAAAEELAGQGAEDNIRLNLVRGELALRGNDVALAAELFRAVLRSAPEERDAIQGLGLALSRLGDPQARRWLEIASRHDQLKRMIQDAVATLHSDTKLFFKLGGICESLNRLEEARAWYRLAIERDPLDDQSQASLSRIERLLKETESKPGRKSSDHPTAR